MNETLPRVLIGPTCDDPSESVSNVNHAFVAGLADDYDFLCADCNRRYGFTRQCQLNGWNLYYLAKHTLDWARHLLKHRPQIAHYAVTSGWALNKSLLMLALARIGGARTVGHLHDGAFLDRWESMSPRLQQLVRTELEKLDAFVVLSESWRQQVCERAGIAPGKLHVVHNPLASDFEHEALAMAVERSGAHLLSLGTMGRNKGVFDLLDACAAVAAKAPEFTLDLAGPELEPGIRDQVGQRLGELQLGSRTRLHGGVFRQAKVELFRRTSIFVLPSYFENFPLVLLEAAAAGHAIIATRVGAAPEFFEDGVSALLVDPGHPSELAAAILRLVQDPGQRRDLGQRAREVFRRRLSRQAPLNGMKTVYQNILGIQPAAAAVMG